MQSKIGNAPPPRFGERPNTSQFKYFYLNIFRNTLKVSWDPVLVGWTGFSSGILITQITYKKTAIINFL